MKIEDFMTSEKLLRKNQVAGMLACSLRTVDRLVVASSLTRVKILGGVRFRFSQVQTLMKGGNHDFQS
jgi:predicted DNA-binding transcriptional regulator AlpA